VVALSKWFSSFNIFIIWIQLFVVFCLKNAPPTRTPKRILFLSSGEGIYYTLDNFLFSIEVSESSSNHTWIKIIKEYIYFIFSVFSCQMFSPLSVTSYSSELSFNLCDKWAKLDFLFLLPVKNSDLCDLSFPGYYYWYLWIVFTLFSLLVTCKVFIYNRNKPNSTLSTVINR
jgi:hypothetical protein